MKSGKPRMNTTRIIMKGGEEEKNCSLEFKSKRFSTIWSLSAPNHLQTSSWLLLLKASIIFLWAKTQWYQKAHNEGLLTGSKSSCGAKGLIMKAFSQAPRAPVVPKSSKWRPSHRLQGLLWCQRAHNEGLLMRNLGMLSKKWQIISD